MHVHDQGLSGTNPSLSRVIVSCTLAVFFNNTVTPRGQFKRSVSIRSTYLYHIKILYPRRIRREIRHIDIAAVFIAANAAILATDESEHSAAHLCSAAQTN
jgi:hypothetical protein